MRAKYVAFGRVSVSSRKSGLLMTVFAGKRLQGTLASLKSSMEQLPETMKAMVVWSYVQVFQPILNASEGKRMCWAIGAVNFAVWLAWGVPRWNAFMLRAFTHNPLSGKSYTLLTSTFRWVQVMWTPRDGTLILRYSSHQNILHLAFNCMALASFGTYRTFFWSIGHRSVGLARVYHRRSC